MQILGNTVLIRHMAIKRKSSLILSGDSDNKDLYDTTDTIIQLGEDCPEKFQVGQEVLLTKWADSIAPPIFMDKDKDGNITVEAIFRTEDIAVIK